MAKTSDKAMASPPATVEAKLPAKLTWDEFRALVKRAENGDKKCLPQLRDALKSGDHANWSRWFRDTFGNPVEWLKNSLGYSIAGENELAVIEATRAQMDEVRKELEGPAPSPTEHLLAERAAICWFVLNLYETKYSQSKELTIRQSEFQLRRIDSAHKRFLSAVATLARVRKLALPTLQVNIGANQVNVAQAGG